MRLTKLLDLSAGQLNGFKSTTPRYFTSTDSADAKLAIDAQKRAKSARVNIAYAASIAGCSLLYEVYSRFSRVETLLSLNRKIQFAISLIDKRVNQRLAFEIVRIVVPSWPSIPPRAYRLCRMSVLACVAVCVLVATIRAVAITGFSPNVASAAVQLLNSDLFDVVSYTTDYFGYRLGHGSRPTAYALICEMPGVQTEAENAANEKQVRSQLAYQSGTAYNMMVTEIRRGFPHPVFILSKSSNWGALFCAASEYQYQDCTCNHHYTAIERGRIPAKELFGPPKTFN